MTTSPYVCCSDCPNLSDDFDRESLGCQWKAYQGDWSIANSELAEAGNAGAIAVYQRAMPSNWMAASIDIQNEAVGGVYRLYVSWKDEDNHLRFDYERLSSTKARLSIYSVISGTEEQLDTLEIDLSGFDPRWISACVDEHLFLASADDLFLCRVFDASVKIADGFKAGVGHGNGTETRFDNWFVGERRGEDNDCARCHQCHCDRSAAPKHLVATYEGTGVCDTLEGITCDLRLQQCGADWIYRGDMSGTCLDKLDMELWCNDEVLEGWILILNQKHLVDGDLDCTPGHSGQPLYPRSDSTCNPFRLIFEIGPYMNIVQTCPDGCLPCGESGPAEGPWTDTQYTVTITEPS